MNFGPEWNHGPRLVLRRVFELIVGPTPSIHRHYHPELWQLPLPVGVIISLLLGADWWLVLLCSPLVVAPFVHWQRPVTDSAYHFHKLGIDILVGPWTQCFHWLDEGVKEDE